MTIEKRFLKTGEDCRLSSEYEALRTPAGVTGWTSADWRSILSIKTSWKGGEKYTYPLFYVINRYDASLEALKNDIEDFAKHIKADLLLFRLAPRSVQQSYSEAAVAFARKKT